MTNRTFIDKMASALGLDADNVQAQVDGLLEELIHQVKDGHSLTVKNFGTFEAKTKAERRVYNPSTGLYRQIAAKQTIGFKMNSRLKDKLNK